jgi:hypothetical protein
LVRLDLGTHSVSALPISESLRIKIKNGEMGVERWR